MGYIRYGFILGFLLFHSTTTKAGVYGEHKKIGDAAFERAIGYVMRDSGLAENAKDILAGIGVVRNGEQWMWRYFSEYNPITFGDLTAASADHVEDPHALAAALLDPRSNVNVCIGLHHASMRRGDLAGSDLALTVLDGQYASLAFGNISHFYRYGESFQEHLDDYDHNHVIRLLADSNIAPVMNSLSSSNLIAKYLQIHAAARVLSHYAGKMRHLNALRSNEALRSAFLYEAYAQHFLQDAFSAGHLPLRRTRTGTFTRDLALHDLFGDAGLEVRNLRGDTWRMYGDRRLEFDAIADSSFNLRIAIEACELSLLELADSYGKGEWNGPPPGISGGSLKMIAQNFAAIKLIPIPYHTDGAELPAADQLTATISGLKHQAEIAAGVGLGLSIEQTFGGERSTSFALSKRGIGLLEAYSFQRRDGWKGHLWFDIHASIEAGRAIDDHTFAQLSIGTVIHPGLGSPVALKLKVSNRWQADQYFLIAYPQAIVSPGWLLAKLPRLFGADGWEENILRQLNLQIGFTRGFRLVGTPDIDQSISRLGWTASIDPLRVIDLVW